MLCSFSFLPYVLCSLTWLSLSLFSSVSGGSGITEGLSKVSKVPKAVRPTTSDIPSTQEERDSLFHKTESSREYDWKWIRIILRSIDLTVTNAPMFSGFSWQLYSVLKWHYIKRITDETWQIELMKLYG